jgi:hypothetical protein
MLQHRRQSDDVCDLVVVVCEGGSCSGGTAGLKVEGDGGACAVEVFGGTSSWA